MVQSLLPLLALVAGAVKVTANALSGKSSVLESKGSPKIEFLTFACIHTLVN